MRRVGHKGADLIAPGNTRESFDAALAAGVDMIEFDVLPERVGEAAQTQGRGRLVLAHDPGDVASRTPLTLQEGLAHLAAAEFAGVELDVDLKLPGYEHEVLQALREHGLLQRALISSQYRSSLSQIRAAEPAVKLGWSVPKLRRDPFRSPLLMGPAAAGLLAFRRILPARARRAISSGAVDALMVHWRLVTPGLVRSVNRTGGELYVWTVDDLPRLRALHTLGVTGVITNDPRLFGQLPVPAVTE